MYNNVYKSQRVNTVEMQAIIFTVTCEDERAR